MDLRTKSSAPGNELPKKVPPDHQSLANFNLQQYQQKWEDSSFQDYGMRIEPQFSEFNNQPSENPSSVSSDPSNQAKIIPDQQDDLMNERHDDASRMQDWDPRAMLNNLSFLEQKIHQLQDLVHLIVGRRGQVMNQSDELVAQQQQLISANLTSIIVQLISTAGSLLPSVKQTLSSNPSISEFGQLGGVIFPSGPNLNATQNINETKVSHGPNQVDISGTCKTEQICTEEHELKDEEDPDEGENLPPGSYEILQLEKEEILAPHTHFCLICGKGFKRDANLRMHMRGHGDEYKTAAALAKPIKESSSEPMLIKRYSCPYAGCKRNKDHKKFQPLKTILCVKNHYKRTHCDKSYTCTRCNTKKFSVIADLKTHEKHCGRDKWLCSCGTTFSRKDKLFGHISLFQGHTPAIPIDEAKGSASAEPTDKVGFAGLNFGSNVVSTVNGVENIVDVKGNADDPASFFSPLTFDSYNLSGFHEFPRPPFDDSETSFSFLISGSCNYPQKTAGGESGSNSNDVE